MKKILFTVLSFITIAATAQTADEIIQKYADGLGGLNAFNKLNSVKITGNYSIQGNDLPLTVQILNGKGMRTEVDAMGQMITSVYYNGAGWKTNPLAGVTVPTDVTGTELIDFKVQSMIASQLMDYKARGHQVELIGKETVDGVETFKIKLTSKEDGRVTTYNLSTKDYSMIRSITTREIQGQSIDVESWFSDLKDFNGVKFYMTRESKIEGQVFQSVKYTNVELNAAIDEKIFTK